MFMAAIVCEQYFNAFVLVLATIGLSVLNGPIDHYIKHFDFKQGFRQLYGGKNNQPQYKQIKHDSLFEEVPSDSVIKEMQIIIDS